MILFGCLITLPCLTLISYKDIVCERTHPTGGETSYWAFAPWKGNISLWRMKNNNFKPASYHIIVGDRSREALQLEEADPGRPVKSRSSVPAQPHVDFFHTGFCISAQPHVDFFYTGFCISAQPHMDFFHTRFGISAQPHANFFLTGFCISSQTHTWISSALDITFLGNHSWIFSKLNFV